MATSGFKLEIFKDIFPNRSINSCRDSPFPVVYSPMPEKMVWLAGGELYAKTGGQRIETIDRVGW